MGKMMQVLCLDFSIQLCDDLLCDDLLPADFFDISPSAQGGGSCEKVLGLVRFRCSWSTSCLSNGWEESVEMAEVGRVWVELSRVYCSN